MTAGTDHTALGDGIGDPKGRMDRMTCQAVRRFQDRHGTVVFMAFCTLGNTAVLFRMTRRTFLFGMFAHLSLQTGSNLGMAQLTAAFQGTGVGDGHQRLMRVCMAFEAFHYRFR